MEPLRRSLQVVRFAMLISIVLYVVITRMIPASTHSAPNPIILETVALLAFADLGILLFLRRILVSGPAEVLRTEPGESAALARWKAGQVITWALAESIALFGVVLHFLGFPITQVAPFFVVGAVVILIFPPRAIELAR